METFDYILKLNEIRRNFIGRQSHPDPSWIRITTITMCSSFDQKIDLVKFREGFQANGPIRLRNSGSKFEGFEWNLAEPKKNKKGSFYNCVVIWCKDFYSTKNVKLFPNGSIHVAGCSSNTFNCWMVLKHVTWIVSKIMGIENLQPQPPRIAMINTNFSLNKQVNIKRVIAYFKSNPKFKVTFHPESYSGVKVAFAPEKGMKEVTTSIFSTGRVIVTGAQALNEIVMAYKTINEGFASSIEMFGDKLPPKPETFNAIMGATFEEWVRVLNEKNRV
jgi:TATA-box binding protein (TBP) (component of TFIID and TFIIIB)